MWVGWFGMVVGLVEMVIYVGSVGRLFNCLLASLYPEREGTLG